MADELKAKLVELLAMPLQAAADSQFLVGLSTLDFLKQFYSGGDKEESVLKFTLSKIGESTDEQKFEVRIPDLALINIPGITLEEMDVEMDIEITSLEEMTYEKPSPFDKYKSIRSLSLSEAKLSPVVSGGNIKVKMKIRNNVPDGATRLQDVLTSMLSGSTIK